MRIPTCAAAPSSAESNIIARIPKGTILTVTGASGNFLCVTYDGQVGYIFKQYAEQVTTNTSESGSVAYGFPYYTTTKSSVNLRTTRSTTSARVTTIPKGATVIIHGVSGDWAQVTYQEKTGYCMTAYLKLLTVVEPTAPPTAVADQRAYLRRQHLQSAAKRLDGQSGAGAPAGAGGTGLPDQHARRHLQYHHHAGGYRLAEDERPAP